MSSPDLCGGVPIHEAAALLDVTVEMLRKRAQRGTLPAYKVDGRWFVIVGADASGTRERQDVRDRTDVQDTTLRPGQDGPQAPPAAVAPAAFAQLAAIRDEWLRPLVTRIEELAAENGRLAERAETVERERSRLAQRLASDRALTDQIVVALEGERDILHAELEQLRRTFGLDANRPAFSPIEVATEPATVGEHYGDAPDRGEVAPGGAQAAPMALDAPRPRPASWLWRLLGRGQS